MSQPKAFYVVKYNINSHIIFCFTNTRNNIYIYIDDIIEIIYLVGVAHII